MTPTTYTKPDGRIEVHLTGQWSAWLNDKASCHRSGRSTESRSAFFARKATDVKQFLMLMEK